VAALSLWLVCAVPATRPRDADLWILGLLIGVNAVYVVAEVVVLLIRVFMPKRGKWPTVVLNLCLLPVFPLGTVLSVYGLRKAESIAVC
jgi:hypothetical protein